ncbi:hypothetical protein [Trueperella pyogenes]|uniref:hypothetical protein n=1 Tax=Trueperella pyogenes TaxID=1661 RepID=UPI00345CCC09
MSLRARKRNIIHADRWGQYVAARQAYMSSPAWWNRRKQWFIDEQARTGKPVMCAGCGKALTENSCDMYHTTYVRLGAEEHDDLIALCRACHEALHVRLDNSRQLRAFVATNPGPATRMLLRQMYG